MRGRGRGMVDRAAARYGGFPDWEFGGAMSMNEFGIVDEYAF